MLPPKQVGEKRASNLVLVTLGSAEARTQDSDGHQIGRHGPGKPFALLTYLSHAPKESASRDRLIELLWADLDADGARHALRQTLWYIKRTLGDGLLITTDDIVRLSVPVDSDSVAFASAVEANEVDRAVLLYGGEFLPSFALPGGNAFEDWAELARGRLRAMFTRSADQIVQRELAAGRARAVLPLARAARDADKDDERLWRRVLEVHLAARDSIGAESEAEALETFLLAEEREAESSTAALLRQARQAPAATDAEPSGGAPFAATLVGRTVEFAALTSAWETVLRGERSAHIHVSAPAGLGKSRLLADVRARLKASRARVVSLRASTSERSIPFALVAELVGALAELKGAAAVTPEVAGILVALNPTVSSRYSVAAEHALESELLGRRILALRDLLGAVAHERPVAVLIDDLHWADERSRAVLAACACRLAATHILVVTTARASARSLFDAATTELVLAPLDAKAIGELWASLGQAPMASWAEHLPELLLRVTGGSPLLVVETIQLAMESGVLRFANGEWGCDAPATLAEQVATSDPIAARIATLSGRERRVLVVLGVIGTPALPDFVAACAAIELEQTAGALQSLEDRGLCRREGSEYEISHDAIAERVMARAEPAELRACHLSAGLEWSRVARTDSDIRRAASHLATADAETELSALSVAWLVNQRRRGDRRGTEALIRAFLGDSGCDERARALRASLPLRLKYPRLVPLSGVAIAAIAVGALFNASKPRPAMELHLAGVYTDGGPATSARLALDERTWVAGDLELSALEKSRTPAFTEFSNPLAPLPDGSAWITWITTSDSGGIDLFRISRSGERVRLTAERGDDGSAIVAPDGRSALFSTSRYDMEMRAQVARLDLASGSVRRLSAPGTIESPVGWSPDGSRLLFSRRDGESRATSACVADGDYSHQECLAPELIPIGWTDDGQLLVLGHDGQRPLLKVNLSTRAVDTLYRNVTTAFLSPDFRWLVCGGLLDGYDGVVWWIAPVHAPAAVRVVRSHGAPVRGLMPVWDIHAPRARFVDRMHILVRDSLESYVATQLAVEAFDPAGAAVHPSVVRWLSLDDSVASLSDDGVLTPHRDGEARIVASAGGWRADTARVAIRARAPRLLYGAPVSGANFPVDWIFFGNPKPRLIATPTGTVLWVAGDSSFASGVRFRTSVSAKHGLSLRARLRVPASLGRWQRIEMWLGSSVADTLWQLWDKTTGAFPNVSALATRCDFSYPDGEGAASLASWYAATTPAFEDIAAPPVMRSGNWFTVEVQLLPDGRCGIAIDDKPVWLSRARQPVATAIEAVVTGMSYHTQVLADSLTLYEGVRRPAWWAGLDARGRMRVAAR